MGQPCDRVCFAGTCAVLYKIVLCRAIYAHICQHFTDDIQLVITPVPLPILYDMRSSPHFRGANSSDLELNVFLTGIAKKA